MGKSWKSPGKIIQFSWKIKEILLESPEKSWI